MLLHLSSFSSGSIRPPVVPSRFLGPPISKEIPSTFIQQTKKNESTTPVPSLGQTLERKLASRGQWISHTKWPSNQANSYDSRQFLPTTRSITTDDMCKRTAVERCRHPLFKNNPTRSPSSSRETIRRHAGISDDGRPPGYLSLQASRHGERISQELIKSRHVTTQSVYQTN